ncbi:hypothetical protein PMAYCL1PPCAC_28262 [Pristionchus mayeri]|uniref:MATH domain-containing protein n=1 Tax=Pristionchus mayeri TaxID=1317129 RepID=A0AAN5D8P7_9BILA|nr:hypothetical protein PMAYCL1PPCAC_28262 [Pristionchus mayeri]
MGSSCSSCCPRDSPANEAVTSSTEVPSNLSVIVTTQPTSDSSPIQYKSPLAIDTPAETPPTEPPDFLLPIFSPPANELPPNQLLCSSRKEAGAEASPSFQMDEEEIEPVRATSIEVSDTHAIIHFEISNMRRFVNLEENEETFKFIFCGVKWSLLVCNMAGTTTGKLMGVYLSCDHQQLSNWSIKVDSSCKFIHSGNRECTKKKSFTYANSNEIEETFKEIGSTYIDGFKMEFSDDENVFIEVTLSLVQIKGVIEFPHYDFSKRDKFNSLALILEGEKLFVNKEVCKSYF